MQPSKSAKIHKDPNSVPLNVLTGCVHTRQKLSEMAKSWILMKLGWVDILIGGVDHTKYLWTGITLGLVGAHPNFEVTRKNQLLCGWANFF